MSEGEAAAETTDTTAETGPTIEQLQAEVDKWKAHSKKNEDRAKSNASAATELEKLRQQSMSDVERAKAEGMTEGRALGLREVGGRLVEAEVRGAAKGRVADVDALIEILDPAKFLDTDGDVDRDAITKWVDRFAPEEEQAEEPRFAQDLGQGNRATPVALGSDPLTQTLKRMTGAR